MSAIDSLLGPRPIDSHDACKVQPRTLLIGDDVLIHLKEDESLETLVLYSVPGRMRAAAWLDRLEEPWCHALPNPDHAQAMSVLSVEPVTRQVFLADMWPRAAIDLVTFGQQLCAHAQRHRIWRAMLQAPHQ